MDLLEYLRQRDATGTSTRDESQVDYRLLCSGTLYRDGVKGDWTRSDVSRILVDAPFKVFVSSSRITENPQELSVRFRIGRETLVAGTSHFTHSPDHEVIEDFAAFLTAATRRLVTVIGKTRTLYLAEEHSILPTDWPNPIFKLSASHWAPRGMTALYGYQSVQLRDNDPPPAPINADRIARQLRALAMTDAQDVLRAVRLYATALELILERPQVAYLLLVSTIETLATEYFKKWAPTEDEQVQHHAAVLKRAKKFGLSEAQARELAIAASRRERWIKRKFVRFIAERLGEEIWTEDDLFPLRSMWHPDRAKLDKYLRMIYDSRSEVVHEGQGLPLGVTVGTSHLVDLRAFHDVIAGALDRTPPIVWFERAVNICLRSRIEEIEQLETPQK
jgi:hypothetical protein